MGRADLRGGRERWTRRARCVARARPPAAPRTVRPVDAGCAAGRGAARTRRLAGPPGTVVVGQRTSPRSTLVRLALAPRSTRSVACGCSPRRCRARLLRRWHRRRCSASTAAADPAGTAHRPTRACALSPLARRRSAAWPIGSRVPSRLRLCQAPTAADDLDARVRGLAKCRRSSRCRSVPPEDGPRRRRP